MRLLDVNVVIAAHRDDHSHFEVARAWLDDLLAGESRGNLMPDVQLAAIALEHACELVSFDHDFARFADLRWTCPR